MFLHLGGPGALARRVLLFCWEGEEGGPGGACAPGPSVCLGICLCSNSLSRFQPWHGPELCTIPSMRRVQRCTASKHARGLFAPAPTTAIIESAFGRKYVIAPPVTTRFSAALAATFSVHGYGACFLPKVRLSPPAVTRFFGGVSRQGHCAQMWSVFFAVSAFQPPQL